MEHWQAHVELDGIEIVSHDGGRPEIDLLTETLAPYGACFGVGPQDGRLGATLTVVAETMVAAADSAVQLVSDALGRGELVSIEVLSSEEAERRYGGGS